MSRISRWEFVVFPLGASVMLLMVVMSAISARREVIEYEHAVYDKGAAAYQAGVPATANPHNGSRGQHWLDGWIDARNRGVAE